MNIQTEINNQLKNNQVVLYMKGSPGNSSCSFSGRVVTILDYIGATYTPINVLAYEDLRRGIKEYANVRTLPLLFVNGEYIGGSDYVRELFESNSLDGFFSERGIKLDPEPNRRPLVLEDVTRDQKISCSKAS